MASLSDRFWSKVSVVNDEDSCWLWTAARNPEGYGHIRIDGRLEGAHRLSYIFEHGEIPSDKPFVLHTCDNPSCVRPKHLYAGTREDNYSDLYSRGSSAWGKVFGDDNWMRTNAPKCSKEIAEEIRRIYREDGTSQYRLADMFDITQSMVSLIILRKRWT